LQVSKDAAKELAKMANKTSWKVELLVTGEIPNETEADKSYYSPVVIRFLYKLATATLFDHFITVCIVANTFFLALDRYPEPPQD